MKRLRLSLTIRIVLLLANLWLSQESLAAETPLGKRGQASFLVGLKSVQGTGLPISTQVPCAKAPNTGPRSSRTFPMNEARTPQ